MGSTIPAGIEVVAACDGVADEHPVNDSQEYVFVAHRLI